MVDKSLNALLHASRKLCSDANMIHDSVIVDNLKEEVNRRLIEAEHYMASEDFKQEELDKLKEGLNEVAFDLEHELSKYVTSYMEVNELKREVEGYYNKLNESVHTVDTNPVNRLRSITLLLYYRAAKRMYLQSRWVTFSLDAKEADELDILRKEVQLQC